MSREGLYKKGEWKRKREEGEGSLSSSEMIYDWDGAEQDVKEEAK